MRKITKICVHHSLTPRDLAIEKSLSSFNNSHRLRLTGMTHSGTNWPHIAYHYIISGEGDVVETRLLEKIGWHASNWNVNRESIGICLTGNFDVEAPSKEQRAQLERLIRKLKKQFPAIESVHGHREFARKTCPGANFTDEYIRELNGLLKPPKPSFSSVGHWTPEAQQKRLQRAIKRSEGSARDALMRQLKRLLRRIGI